MTAYCQQTTQDLVHSEARILATEYNTREEIDVAFYGWSEIRSGRDERIEAFAKSYAEKRNGERFHRRAYRNQLQLTFGGLSYLTVLYYIVVALWYWRRLTK